MKSNYKSKMYTKLEKRDPIHSLFLLIRVLGFYGIILLQYTTMGNAILIIDCNYLFLFCFYFASQWTGWATQPVYLLCPMYVYIICSIDINLSCVVPLLKIVSQFSVSVPLSMLHVWHCSVLIHIIFDF